MLKLPALLLLGVLTVGTARAQHFEYKEHHLGPTGLFGVTSPTDIKITKVDPGSPADGKLKAGDVIVAAGGMAFKDNTRPQLAAAIDQAETEKAKGILTVTLKDNTKVDLQLKVLGSYSGTAPYNCPKTDAIITQAAEALVKSRDFGAHQVPVGLLGLLATGEPKYIEVVRNELHSASWAKPDFKLSLGNSSAWGWGYTNLVLAEYYLLTGDDYVLPALKTYSMALAQGRDAAGLWGHRMANPESNRGQLHGRLPGYAVMNQSSLPCFVSILLADKCGIKDPEITACIKQTGTFYKDFINKGTPAYGVHDPRWNSYNNNGMSGLVAVAMSLQGNKEGSTFFSRMSAAGSDTLESGHTGHYFSQLWTGLGADLAGPEASAAFFRETRWLHTLNRNWDGNFTYDCCGYKEPIYSYRGLSDAGSHLLNYCLGRHKLYITGRDADPSIWLKGKDVADTIALAKLDIKGKSDEELLAMFGHPMPKIRGEAAWTLRDRQHKLLGPILKMIKVGTKDQRLSAIGYFGYKCPPEVASQALADLGALLRDPKEDLELRAAAAGSLCFMGKEAYPFFDDILKLLLIDKPNDPTARIDEKLGSGLVSICPDPYAAGLVKDKELFYNAARKLLVHKRSVGRIYGTQLVRKMPLEDFHHVGENLDYILKDQDITYHSYHNLGPQTESMGIYANLRVDGGIEAAFRIFEAETGKAGFKIRMLTEVMPKYGASAKPYLPKLKAVKAGGKFEKPWNEMLKSIENADEATKMLSFDEAMRAGADRSKH